MNEELTFAMLHTRKPKRGTCMRCFENPTQGMLQIQVYDRSGNTPGVALISLTTSLCLACLELMYRRLATSLTQPVMFGNDICPRCNRDRPVNGRLTLTAKKSTGSKKQGHNPAYISMANSTYKYCESCTVHMYRAIMSLRDSILTELVPNQTTMPNSG